ncbi:MAG: 50S ribosomal protein L35 [bacterium]|nr:50S ribosomal protein L35 [bacterium]
MPKMKSNRAAAKRFKRTGKGRVKRYRAYSGHLREAKSPKRLRKLRKSTLLDKTNEEQVRVLLPYIKKKN